jgi:hypothetical protein
MSFRTSCQQPRSSQLSVGALHKKFGGWPPEDQPPQQQLPNYLNHTDFAVGSPLFFVDPGPESHFSESFAACDSNMRDQAKCCNTIFKKVWKKFKYSQI